jgi:large subunit ribosomal protein L10
MNKEKKAELTGEIKELLDGSNAIYFTDFTGLTVAQVNNLRDEFHKANLVYKVVKNTLTTRALSETDKYSDHRDKLNEYLKGPTGIIFVKEDPVTPAKIIKKNFDKVEKPKLKVAIVENELYDSKALNTLASLLTKEELISGILGSLDAPASGIVGSINAVMRDLYSVIEEVARKKAA